MANRFFFCFFFIPFFLHGLGFLTPNWVNNGNCTRLGLFYRCCGNGTEECQMDNADTYMNKSAISLQSASFVILLFTVVSFGWMICSSSDDDVGGGSKTCLCSFVCSLLLYLVSVLILIGCRLVAADYPTSSLGISYYLSVIAGCIIIVQVVVICFLVCKQRNDDGNSGGYGQNHEMSVSATSSSGLPVRSGGNHVAGQVISHEESGMSGGVAFVRRIQIVRIMRLSHMIE